MKLLKFLTFCLYCPKIRYSDRKGYKTYKTSINVQTSHTLNDKHHKRIKTITNTTVELNNPTFSFDFISREEIVKETEKLCNKTAP